MGSEEISQISIGEFENVSQLIASSESLQFAFFVMIVGIIAIVAKILINCLLWGSGVFQENNCL